MHVFSSLTGWELPYYTCILVHNVLHTNEAALRQAVNMHTYVPELIPNQYTYVGAQSNASNAYLAYS